MVIIPDPDDAARDVVVDFGLVFVAVSVDRHRFGAGGRLAPPPKPVRCVGTDSLPAKR